MFDSIKTLAIISFVYALPLLPIANYALLYHVAKYSASEEAVRIFIANLHFPLNRFFADFPERSSAWVAKYPPDELMRVATAKRIFNSIFNYLFILILLSMLLRQSQVVQAAIGLGTILLLCRAYWCAWCFGNELEDIVASLQKQNDAE